MTKVTAGILINNPGVGRRGTRGARSAYLKIKASDGNTYLRVGEMFRGKMRCTYSSYPTDSQAIDREIAWGKMPKAVRDMMRANPAVIEQPVAA